MAHEADTFSLLNFRGESGDSEAEGRSQSNIGITKSLVLHLLILRVHRFFIYYEIVIAFQGRLTSL